MATNPHLLASRRLKCTAAFVLAAVLVPVIMLTFASPAAAGPRDYLGYWTSTDFDGSHQTLWIRGTDSHEPGNVAITYRDDVASNACGGAPARVAGTGRFDGDVLLMRGALTCSPGGNHVHGRIDLGFIYDPGSDTLVDFDGIVWERA